MSAVQEIVFARLSANAAVTAIVGTGEERIFPGPDNAPQGSRGVRPRLIYFVTSEDETTDSDAGPTGHVVSQVQIDCQSTTATAARTLADAVRAPTSSGGPLNGLSGTVGSWKVDYCFRHSGADEYDDGDGFTVTLDFELAYYPA